MRRVRALMVTAVLGVLGGIGVGPAATMVGSSVATSSPSTENQAAKIFTATADTSIDEDRPTANHGGEKRLGVLGSPKRRVLLTFTVKGLPEATNAILRLRTSGENSGSADGGTVRSVTATGWKENAITWATAPPADGPVVGSFGPVLDDAWHAMNVSSVVTGNGTYSFSITSEGDDAAEYASREAGDRAPQLVVLANSRLLAIAATGAATAPGSPSASSPVASSSATLSPSPSSPSKRPSSSTTPPPSAGASAKPRTRLPATAVLVGAGDVGTCRREGDSATTKLLEKIPGTIFTAGDTSQDDGEPQQYEECVDPTWGTFKNRLRPAPGNHDYFTEDAAGYFGYFGKSAGVKGKGYYSYDLGNWHVVALNSNCDKIGGCGEGSAQERWLRADLAANDKPCTAAYWHHSLFTSSDHEPEKAVKPLFAALYDNGAEIVMNGHNHVYERFAPQDPDGSRDNAKGIRQFTVGTGGGGEHYAFGTIQDNSEVRNNDTYGVLKLTLKPDGYSWAFVPVEGGDFTDSGKGSCH
ncbi:MAG: acid phosphatase type 7 [Actinomycetota bacterium]|nr:acid phosphatase type 7 [Actinomycetota bacterium]